MVTYCTVGEEEGGKEFYGMGSSVWQQKSYRKQKMTAVEAAEKLN